MKLHKQDVIAKYSYHFDAKLAKNAKWFDSVGKRVRSLQDSPEESKHNQESTKLNNSMNWAKPKQGKD